MTFTFYTALPPYLSYITQSLITYIQTFDLYNIILTLYTSTFTVVQASHIPGLLQYLASLEHPELEMLTEGDGSSLVASFL